jgi:hypothetical protein
VHKERNKGAGGHAQVRGQRRGACEKVRAQRSIRTATPGAFAAEATPTAGSRSLSVASAASVACNCDLNHRLVHLNITAGHQQLSLL